MQCWNCNAPCHYHTCDKCKAPQYNARAAMRNGVDKNGPSTLYLENVHGYWYAKLWGHNYDSPARIKICNAVTEASYLSFASSDVVKIIAEAYPSLSYSDSALLEITFFTSNEDAILTAAIKLANISGLELEIY